MKKTKITRKTLETQITLELNIEGTGKNEIELKLKFLKHMLELFSKHSLIDLKLKAFGDTEIDDHHLTEDIGITLGQAIKEAIQNKIGINRFGSVILPMDDVLIICAIDLSGRSSFETNYKPILEKAGDFSTELMPHFFKSIANNANLSLHLQYLKPGQNEHHKIESAFKAFGRALRQACEPDARIKNQLPSTKGIL